MKLDKKAKKNLAEGKLARSYISAGSLLVTAIAFIFGGIALLIWQDQIPRLLNGIISIYALVMGAAALLSCAAKFTLGKLVRALLTAGLGLALLLFPNTVATLYPMLFAAYIVVLAVVKLISWWTYKKNDIPGRLHTLIAAVVMLLLALPTLFDPFGERKFAMLFTAVFLIFYGVSQLGDFIREVLPMKQTDGLKRRVRVGLPVIFTTLLPKKTLDYINEMLRVTGEVEEESYRGGAEDSAAAEPELEILVHVTEEGTGTMGHVDVCYKGRIYCYGCYDYKSLRLFGGMGDGVFFTCDDRDGYIKFCAEITGDSIFAFGLRLTDAQRESVEKQIAWVYEHTYRWKSIKERMDSGELPEAPIDPADYASNAYSRAGVTLYKFRDTKFKTFFVLNTNCCMLADTIVGGAGCAVININGLITPGAYFDYLERQYEMPNGIVVSRRTYHHSAPIKHNA